MKLTLNPFIIIELVFANISLYVGLVVLNSKTSGSIKLLLKSGALFLGIIRDEL